MQDIEPYRRWEKIYNCYKDKLSPFYGLKHDPFLCRNTIYDHYIHPGWDEFGSNTLYMNLLYADYDKGAAIIELMGEWNDLLYNDIMYLKRNIIEHLEENNISKFILIGENVLNFHFSDDSYYEDWFNDLEDGWIAAVNFREHVLSEFDKIGLYNYMIYDGVFNEVKWRIVNPDKLVDALDAIINRSLNP
jgi:hypothetical protein